MGENLNDPQWLKQLSALCNADNEIANDRETQRSLIIVSVIQQLCTMLESDPEKRNKLYFFICDKLHNLKLIDNWYDRMELEALKIKGQYQKALFHLVSIARETIYGNYSLKNLNWLIDYRKYQTEFDELHILGSGGFGCVYKVRHWLDGNEYAVKKIFIPLDQIENIAEHMTEVQNLARFNHPNIIPFKGAWMERMRVTPSPIGEIQNRFPSFKSLKSKSNSISRKSKSLKNISAKSSRSGSSQSNTEQTEHSSSESSQSNTEQTEHSSSESSQSNTEQTERSSSESSQSNTEQTEHSSSESSQSNKEQTEHSSSESSQSNKEQTEHSSSKSNRSTAEQSDNSSDFTIEFSLDQCRSKLEENKSVTSTCSQDEVTDQQSIASVNLYRTDIIIERLRELNTDICTIDKRIVEENSPWITTNSDSDTVEFRDDGEVSPTNLNNLNPSRHKEEIDSDETEEIDCDDPESSKPSSATNQESVILYIQMALSEKSLSSWLHERTEPSSDAVVKKILTQIVAGLEHIHSVEAVHHDLTPNNILITTANHHIQLGDFGLACPVDQDHKPDGGTLPYVAPEQIEGLCECKSDLFSLGVILLELLVPMRTSMELDQTLAKLKDGECPATLRDRHEWFHLLRRLLAPDPSNRPTAAELLHELSEEKDAIIARNTAIISKLTSENEKLREQLTQLQTQTNPLNMQN